MVEHVEHVGIFNHVRETDLVVGIPLEDRATHSEPAIKAVTIRVTSLLVGVQLAQILDREFVNTSLGVIGSPATILLEQLWVSMEVVESLL